MLKEIFLLINYGGRGFEYKVELCPTLYTDSLLFTQDVLYTQSPTLRDLGKGWKSPKDSKQEIVLFKYMKTLYNLVQGCYFELVIIHPYMMKTGTEKTVVRQVIEVLLSSHGLIRILKESAFSFLVSFGTVTSEIIIVL